MNKAELINALADRFDSRKEAGFAVDTVLDEIMRGVVRGEKVSITGFGVFEKRERKARTARNPRTGEPVKVKKTAVPAFKPGQGFKDLVNGSKKLAKAAKAPAKAAAKTAKKAAKAAPAKKSAKKTAKKATKRGRK